MTKQRGHKLLAQSPYKVWFDLVIRVRAPLIRGSNPHYSIIGGEISLTLSPYLVIIKKQKEMLKGNASYTL